MAITVINGAPILAVSDFAASLSYYTDGLGFTIEAQFDGPSFAILAHGPVKLCLAEQGHASPDFPSHVMTVPDDPSRMGVRIVLWVADVHAVHAELASKGIVRIASEPWSPPWGGGRFFTQDPDGYLVEFETLA
jgi:catechol 2,3-dioxygenase-like lactoylglutathione lyase family enzyme